jgi:hypothetical protein
MLIVMQLELLGVQMKISNNDRAKKVKRLLGLSGNKESEDTDNSYVRVADVLCDLQHYCDKYVIDMSQEKYMADVFYNDEISQEDESWKDYDNRVKMSGDNPTGELDNV